MTDVTRYYCPLDCGWHHDQPSVDFTDPNRLYPLADIPAPEGIDAIAFQATAGELMAIEAIVKAHLETHGMADWVQAVIRIKAEREQLAELTEARHRVINRLAREAQTAEAAVERVRDWLSGWGPRLPDGACHTLDRALDGTPQLAEPRHVDYPIGNPRPGIVDHTYAGPPTFGQRCQDDLAGATCGGLFEDHVMREPCCHLDSKQPGARPGDLSTWCPCGAKVSPGLPNLDQEPE